MTASDWTKDAYQHAILRHSEITDPGDTGTIVMTTNQNFASCAMVSAAAQTRYIATPPGVGMYLTLWLKSDGGDVTVTFNSAYDGEGGLTVVFTAAGQMLKLESVENGANTYRWRVIAFDGVYGPGIKVETVTATNVITPEENGKTFFLSSATEFVSTLPAPLAGLKYTFIVAAAPSGASYTIVTNGSSNIILGQTVTSDVASAGGDADSETSGCDTITIADGVAVVGDRVDVISDGTNWYATAYCKAYNGITFDTAS